MTREKGWYPDPTQRHEKRFWDGTEWTSTVYDDAGVVDQDPDPLHHLKQTRTPVSLADVRYFSSARIASSGNDEAFLHAWWSSLRSWWGQRSIFQKVLIVFVAWGAIGSMIEGPRTTEQTTIAQESTAPPAEAHQASPPSTGNTTTTTTTSLPRTDEERLSAAIDEALRDSNRGVERFTVTMTELDAGVTIDVEWAINDHFSLNDAAEIEATDILRAVHESGVEYHELWLHGSFSMTRQNGTTAEDVVVQALYPRASVDQIDFDSLLFDNIFEIADQATVHIEFQE